MSDTNAILPPLDEALLLRLSQETNWASNYPGKLTLQAYVALSLSDALRRLAEVEAANVRMIEAINWACGCGDGDFRRIDDTKGGPFWWRSELAYRAKLRYDGSKYTTIPPAPTEAP